MSHLSSSCQTRATQVCAGADAHVPTAGAYKGPDSLPALCSQLRHVPVRISATDDQQRNLQSGSGEKWFARRFVSCLAPHLVIEHAGLNFFSRDSAELKS